ncbi:MAG: YciI family protein [Gammaproteobacteria bacterium]
MAKYLFVYHGGSKPESKDEQAKVMDAWGQWFGSMGSAVIDGGNPVGLSSTVQSDGSVVNNGGANPASGYSLIEASDLDDAVAKAKGCPILASGGSIELAQAFDM